MFLYIEQKMVCHGEHTYLFAQAMMSILAQEEQGGSAVRRIGQEVQKFALQRYNNILCFVMDTICSLNILSIWICCQVVTMQVK